MTDATDAELIARVRGGDGHAFTRLVERHQARFFRFAVRILGTREDADEALQDAFVRAHRALDQCTDPSRFAAWFYRIVTNECRTRATRRQRREKRLVRDEDLLTAMPDDRPGADAAVAAGLDERLSRALDALVPEQREAFVLKYVEDLSYDEMAEATGVGVSALKMRVKRAAERLRTLLEETSDA